MEAPFPGPTLRLLPKTGSRRRRGDHLRLLARDTRPAGVTRTLCPAAGSRPVLLAGGDALERAAVLHDLRQTMPEGTSFMQTGALWEMLAHAGESSMVVLSGDLDHLPTEALMQMLAHRNPKLPVITLDRSSAQEPAQARA
jgi:hypothetical protein